MPLINSISVTAMLAVSAITLAAPKQVLIQEFTATWCPHCRNVGEGVSQLLEQHPNYIGMMIHFADDYEVPFSQELIDFYGLPGHPSTWVDGTWNQIGSVGDGDANEASIGALADLAELTTDVTLAVSGSQYSDTQYMVTTTVAVEPGGESRDMRVYLAQVNSDTAWPEHNEVQFNTVLQSAPTQQVSLDPGGSNTASFIFDMPDASIDAEDISYIAWAQDNLDAPPAMVRQSAVHDHGDTPPCDCPGDLDCNQSVDVDDLLGLLSAWGTDGGDTDGDGDTDVDDLLLIISSWGPC